MLAVLHDAFDCYQKYLFAIDREGRELFEGAAAWIKCTSKDHLFSFESITEALDIEPSYFRRGLAEWHKRHIAAQHAAPAVSDEQQRHVAAQHGTAAVSDEQP